jgi:hypothetical protein
MDCNILEKKFVSVDDNHEFVIKIVDDIAWFSIIRLECSMYRTLILLLKDAILFMHKKNVKYIKQEIMKNDVEFFKNSESFDIDDTYSTVTTSIEYFADDMYNALNIQTL